jgi:CPA2 family monovalent cation:H+ antiporter-2
MPQSLQFILILLCSSVLGVAMFRALRLPALLAYFVIGMSLGSQGLGVIPDNEATQEMAEFGIVFLMFSIGLEFSLPQLYAMRRTVVGLGSAQVIVTMLLAAGIAVGLGASWSAALVIAGALAMSSTAIVSKLLVERVELNSRHGRIAIGVLLFQDIAVVPLLILIPALAEPGGDIAQSLIHSAIKAAVALAILLVFGKRLLNPWFNVVARQRSRELFVMNVLMVTLILAAATHKAGLSYALGAFIAGMLISETKYRYQVESDIAPFRDILMGLFFVTIGMKLDIAALGNNFHWILLLLIGLVLVKAGVVALLSRRFGFEGGVAIRAGLTLAQAGEFSFVILSLGQQNQLIGGQALQIVLAASLLSMVIAPFVIQQNGRIARRLSRSYRKNQGRQAETIGVIGQELKDHVVICGYGRSGQYLARFLKQENIPFIALDIDPARVQEASAAGESVVYGDAGRRVVLEAAGVDRAKALVISYDDSHSVMKILHLLRELYPNVPVIVRTVDDTNLEKFREAGAAEVVPEVLEGSLMLASHALMLLGVPMSRVVKRIRHFREERYKLFRGYFHGVSDYDLEASEKDQVRLHSVTISSAAFALEDTLDVLGLSNMGVEVKSIRRSDSPEIEPKLGVRLQEGDILVLLGNTNALAAAEQYLLTGK